MSAPYAAGAKSLLFMFQIAKILPKEFKIESTKSESKSHTQKLSSDKKGGRKKQNGESSQETFSNDEWYNYKLDNISLSINKKINLDDLDFAKNQLEQFIVHVKKKIESNNEEV